VAAPLEESAQRRSGLRLLQAIRPVSGAGALRDALAGFTLAAMNVPQALGYTRIANMPVVNGDRRRR
jgi:sulfate permease, SulP family